MSDDLGLKEIQILQILLGRDKYGLEIIKRVKEDTGRKMSLGGLYTTMHRLEKKGYVKSRWGETTPERKGNRRKYYCLTGAGRKSLQAVRQSLSPLLKWEVQGV